jgi:quercetin dioxygenase-like cupin family protein
VGEDIMKITKLGHALALAGVLSLGAAFSLDVQSAEKPKAVVTKLLRVPLAEVEGKEVVIIHFSLPPGFVGGKHFHPGPVFVYVLEGELTVETDAGIETISAGKIYREELRQTMRGKNLSTTDAAKIVVFQVGDTGKPMMVKVK